MVASAAVSRLQPWKFAIFVARYVRFCTAVNTTALFHRPCRQTLDDVPLRQQQHDGGGNMSIIAFITDGVQISKILAHIPAGVRHGNGASGGSRAHARVDRPGCPAAFSPTASPVPAALRAGTTSSLPTPASVAGSAPPAPPAAWWRPQRIWPTMSSRAWPLRQWVLSVPKRLRYHLERDSAVPIAALHFLAAAAAMRLNLLRRLTCAETSFS